MTEALVAVFAFLGGGLGAYLTFRATQRATAQQEGQSRREEWGRRFTVALEMVSDPHERRQIVGQTLLSELAASELASAEERQLADKLLYVASRDSRGGVDLELVGRELLLDEVAVVEDDGDERRDR